MLGSNVLKAIDHIKQASKLLSSGPLDFYLRTLVEHSEALLTKFAPIKKGEKAAIVEQPPCDDGWAQSEKTLRVGCVGTIHEVEYYDDHFVLIWVPDVEWAKVWKTEDWIQVPEDQRHSYALHEKYLRKE